MAGCMTLQSLVCAPAAAAAVSWSRCAVTICSSSSSSSSAGSANWGQRVSLKAAFVPSLPHGRSASLIARQAAVAELSDFAVQESAKFREALLEKLEANSTTASEKAKIADICSKIFGDYVEKYDGKLSPAPFGEMKDALDSQKLPGGAVAICAALGWSRGHLHHDWKMSQAKK